MSFHRFFTALAFCGALGLVSNVWSADAPANKILVAKTFRTSQLKGLNVRNHQGESLGKVEDFVVNIESGKVLYAAMSFGGVFGIGDKLFAVPFANLKFDHGNDEMFFVLNISKDKLKAAPGFDKNDWPNFADPHWMDTIDNYYRDAQTTTTSTKNVTK